LKPIKVPTKVAIKLWISPSDDAALRAEAAKREWSRQHVIEHAIREFLAGVQR
jgi:hypothetical protein